MMNSLIYIIEVVLSRKENYCEWSMKIKYTSVLLVDIEL